MKKPIKKTKASPTINLQEICTINLFRALHNKMYNILLEDTGLTHNINMHTFSCFAVSEDEAVGKMCRIRPELKGRAIESIKIS